MSFFKKLFGTNSVYKPGKLDLNRPIPLGNIFPDVNLAHCVLNALNLRAGRKLLSISEPVTIEDLKEIRSLKASNMEIHLLEGMEYLIKLNDVDLSHNFIETIPFNIEDITRLNNKYKGGFTLNLFAYRMDLSDNRLGYVPELVTQYRSKERNLFIDLSNNPVIDPETKQPTIEGCVKVLKEHLKEPPLDQTLFWILYYINAYYLVKNSTALTGFSETTPGDFMLAETFFYKTTEGLLGIHPYAAETLDRHENDVVNDRGEAAIAVKKTEQENIKKIADYILSTELVPTDETEPFKGTLSGENVNVQAIERYYVANTDKICPALFSKDILSDSLTPEKKRQLEQALMVKNALQTIEIAVQGSNNAEITQKLNRIADLIQEIAVCQNDPSAPIDFSFEVNYLPMTLNIIEQYTALNQNTGKESAENQVSLKTIESSFDTIIEGFTNYTQQFKQSDTMTVYSDVEALTSLFKTHGLTPKK